MQKNGNLKFINYGKDGRLYNSNFERRVTTDNVISRRNCEMLMFSLVKEESVDDYTEALPNSNVLPQEFSKIFQEIPAEANLIAIKSPENEGNAPANIMLKRHTSRLEDDFKDSILLGTGGFGKVYKVLKKSDNRTYALKEIVLKPNHEELNKKLKREVVLLSQLQHENIVRYYTSWSDFKNIDESNTESSEDDGSTEDDEHEDSYSKRSNKLLLSLADCKKIDISSIYHEDDSNEDDSVQFLRESGNTNDTFLNASNVREILYIQMEFCEKLTLKNMIDDGKLEKVRILKYLREIVDGLVYIHNLKIIHRDLKPLNIFLSSDDHIKIGDFGLATKRIHYKKVNPDLITVEAHPQCSTSDSCNNTSLTSQVGTELYMAPELVSEAYICDTRLDMYSLGIILFEMCYKRPPTTCEWNKIIGHLRSKDIIFPTDFDTETFSKEQEIIQLLLNHNVSQRPTSKELLKHDNILPNVKSEEAQKVIKYVIDKPELKLHKYLMDRCFDRENEDVGLLNYSIISNSDTVNKTIIETFKTHGAENISRSGLTLTKHCRTNCNRCIKFMNRLSRFSYIPCNNNIPFIEYAALNDNIKWMKCYSLDKAITNSIDYRYDNLRYEGYEYNFNIITPIDFSNLTFLPDAEILAIINRIKNSLFNIQANSFKILINHVLLAKAILMECNISNYDYIYSPSCSNSMDVLRENILTSNNINFTILEKLPNTINLNKNLDTILDLFTNQDARSKAKKGLHELSSIIRTARKFDLKNHEVLIMPKLFDNFSMYSGMFFVLRNVKKDNIFATGGRYDDLLRHFQENCTDKHWVSRKHSFKYGVGMTLNLESWGELLPDKKDTVLICISNKKMMIEKVKILTGFWNAEISCRYFKAKSKKHLMSYCRNNSVSFAITLSRDTKKKVAEVIDFKKDR